MKESMPLVPIGELVTRVATWNPQNSPAGHRFDYIDISSINQATKCIERITRIEASKAPSRARQIVHAGDVLVSTVRPNLNAVAQVPEHLHGAIASTGFTVLRPHSPLLSSRFLFYWVRTPGFIRQMVKLATGASYPAVNDGIVKESKIPLPSISEQKRICTILDIAGRICIKCNKTLQFDFELLRSTFVDIFGNANNPKKWPENSLGEYLGFVTSGSRGWAKYYSASGDAFLRIQNIGRNELLLKDLAFVKAPNDSEAARTMVQPGDILLSITADLGRTAVVPDDLGVAYVNQHIAILRVKDLEPIYISEFLASCAGQIQFQKLNKQGVKAGLNFDDIKSIRIITPPLALQKLFVSIWKKRQSIKEKHQRLQKEADSLFDCLLQHAFRGEL